MPTATTRRPAGLTLDPYVKRYIGERRARGELGDRTSIKAESILRDFSQSFGRRPVERLSTSDVERWIERQVKAGLKPSTRSAYLSRVRGFVAWLRRRRLIAHDPMLDIRPPRQPRRLVRILELDEVDKVLAVVPDKRGTAIVQLMYVCGVRCVEVSRLDVEDWNRTGGTLRVVGKAGHEREIPVMPVVAAALNAYLATVPAATGPLFRSYTVRGNRLTPSYIGSMISGWQTAAGVKLRPYDGISAHAFRRTAATELLRATNDLTSTQELLGHASAATLAPYIQRANVERVRAALSRRLDVSQGPESTESVEGAAIPNWQPTMRNPREA